MVKNNLTIIYNGVQLEYDEETAVGINFNAWQIENVGDTILDYTRSFSLPITPNNAAAFGFVTSVHSFSLVPYSANTITIAVNGVQILRGSCFVEKIDERINLQVVVNFDIFNALKSLQFVQLQGDTLPQSLASLFVTYWNTTIRTEIRTQYEPSQYSEWLDAVVNYCSEKATIGNNPKNKVIIPCVCNQFGLEKAKYNDDGTLESGENNIYSTNESGWGFCVAQSFPQTTITTSNTSSTVTIDRYNDVLLSPLWVRLDLVLQLIENYLASVSVPYTFGNLYTKIKAIVGRELFIHIPGVELEYSLAYVDGVRYVNFLGYTKVIKGGSGVYGCKYTSGASIDDLTDDDLPTYTCCDLIVSLINDYALIFDIDAKNKTFVFNNLNALQSSPTYALKLASDSKTKSFSLDGYNQKQSILYKGVGVSDETFGGLQITTNNVNIDEGAYTDALFTIERYLFALVEYKHRRNSHGFGYTRLANLQDNEIEKNFIFCTAVATGIADGQKVYIGLCEKNNTNVGHAEFYLYAGDTHKALINQLQQPAVSTSGVYDLLQSAVSTPIVYELQVELNAALLFNFKRFATCTIEGVPGLFYIQNIKDYNPRTDTTLTLTIVRIANNAEYSEVVLASENDVPFATENNYLIIPEN